MGEQTDTELLDNMQNESKEKSNDAILQNKLNEIIRQNKRIIGYLEIGNDTAYLHPIMGRNAAWFVDEFSLNNRIYNSIKQFDLEQRRAGNSPPKVADIYFGDAQSISNCWETKFKSI